MSGNSEMLPRRLYSISSDKIVISLEKEVYIMLRMKKTIKKEALEYQGIVTPVEMLVPVYKMEQVEENLVLVKEPCGPFVHKNFGVICMIAQDTTGKFGMIIKDQFFDELPKFVQEFVMQHEIGHFKNGHHLRGEKNKLPNFIRMFGITNGMEFAAYLPF